MIRPPPLAMHGDVPGAVWPPLFSTRVASLAALVQQLEQTQWLTAEAIAARQHAQLAGLVRHFAVHSPPFRARLAAAGLDPDATDDFGADALRRLPPLTRRVVQAEGEALWCAALPPGHAPASMLETSGSTGEPVRVRRTAVGALFWDALTVRYNLWHEPDFDGRLCALRATWEADAELADWGFPIAALYPSGPSARIANNADLGEQIARVAAFRPRSLLIYPSNLAALLDRLDQTGATLPSIERVRTIGETLAPDARLRAAHRLGVTVRDCYSSEEFGYIAIECPEGGLYHLMAETLLVEIVDDDGAPCPPGRIGRVLVTDLHNHAMPLIRYAIGDHAEAGPPCRCGRGLPTLARIVGRERNMLLTPGGKLGWPLTGFRAFRAIGPVIQYQLVQHRPDAIELRLVVGAPLTPAQEDRLRAAVRYALGHPFEIGVRYYEGAIPPQPNGKFEEFYRSFA